MAQRRSSAPLRPGRERRTASEIERQSIALWFAATADVAVRVLYAPFGCGKSVAARQYVARHIPSAAYVRVPAGADAATLRALVGGVEADEIVLDDVDRAESGACTALVEDVLDGLVPCRLVFVGRSRRRMHVHGLLARGLAAACDPALFAFDVAELAELAANAGLEPELDELAQIVAEIDGWPLVADAVVDEARTTGCSLAEALRRWCERDANAVLHGLRDGAHDDAAAFETFGRILRDGWDDAQHELERLDQLGFPIVRAAGAVRPYRVLANITGRGDGLPLMLLNVLGRFRCEIAGKPIAFARRRDQHVFAYVATAPDARASRDELLEAFWPGVERSAANQGLRITLSRIRRAIGEAAPNGNADGYLRTAGEVAIETRFVTIDARRFVDHVEQGRIDDAHGNVEGAKHHYRSARRLYADRFLAGEGPQPCLEPRAAQLESLRVEMLTRLMSLFAATGELDRARTYARELIDCNTEDARRRAYSLFTASARSASA